jgi:REP element-mobilizing transposase RayT
LVNTGLQTGDHARKIDISRFNGLFSTADVPPFPFALWIHLIWGTLNREKLLAKEAAQGVSAYLTEYAKAKGIYMKINYVNADHVHALIDLPTSLSVEELMQLWKGSSSHWINENNLVPGKFAWGRGYAAFLRVRIKCRSSRSLHRRARGASSRAQLRRGVQGICRAARIVFGGSGKPLKRLRLFGVWSHRPKGRC